MEVYMNKKLFTEAILKYISGLIIVSLLLFIPAGSLKYQEAWIFLGLLFIPMFIVGIILIFKNPRLLKSRLDAKEKENTEKIVILISALMFISGFIVAGLNYRFNWHTLPKTINYLAIVIFIISYILYGIVLKENTYLARTVSVSKDQSVIDTGLYSIVRHPMYSVTIPLFLLIPLILSSPFSFLIFMIYPFLIIKRIKNEEIVLARELNGYKEYQKKVKYRLIPYIW